MDFFVLKKILMVVLDLKRSWLVCGETIELTFFHLFSLFKLKFDLCTLRAIRANHVSSSQSDRSKRVTCRCIKSLNAHFASLTLSITREELFRSHVSVH